MGTRLSDIFGPPGRVDEPEEKPRGTRLSDVFAEEEQPTITPVAPPNPDLMSVFMPGAAPEAPEPEPLQAVATLPIPEPEPEPDTRTMAQRSRVGAAGAAAIRDFVGPVISSVGAVGDAMQAEPTAVRRADNLLDPLFDRILPRAERGPISSFLLGGAPDEESTVGERLVATGQRIQRDPRFAPSDRFDPQGGAQPGDIDWWIERGTPQLGQLAIQLGLMGATRGRSIPAQFAAFASPTLIQEGGGAILRAQEDLAPRVAAGELTQEQADEMARAIGAVTGIGASALERISFGAFGPVMSRNPALQRVFTSKLAQGLSALAARATGETARTAAGRIGGRAIHGSLAEGLEEASQGALADAVAWAARTDPDAFRDGLSAYVEEAILGAAFGGAVNTARASLDEWRGDPDSDDVLEIQRRVAAGEDLENVVQEVVGRRARGEERPRRPGVLEGARRRMAEVVDPSIRTELEGAYRDGMTGLANPAAFVRARERLDENVNIKIAALDVRNLKGLNDIVGREQADAFLAEVGRVMRELAPRFNVEERDLFRAGGDEFAIAGTGDVEGLAREVARVIGERPIGDSGLIAGVRVGFGSTWFDADAAAQVAKKEEVGPRYRTVPGTDEVTPASEAVAEADEQASPPTLPEDDPEAPETVDEGRGEVVDETDLPRPEPEPETVDRDAAIQRVRSATDEELMAMTQIELRGLLRQVGNIRGLTRAPKSRLIEAIREQTAEAEPVVEETPVPEDVTEETTPEPAYEPWRAYDSAFQNEIDAQRDRGEERDDEAAERAVLANVSFYADQFGVDEDALRAIIAQTSPQEASEAPETATEAEPTPEATPVVQEAVEATEDAPAPEEAAPDVPPAGPDLEQWVRTNGVGNSWLAVDNGTSGLYQAQMEDGTTVQWVMDHEDHSSVAGVVVAPEALPAVSRLDGQRNPEELPKARKVKGTNEYDVEVGGVTYRIYRDPDTRMWYETPERTGLHYSNLYLGNTKTEAIQRLVEGHREGTLQPTAVVEEPAPPPTTTVNISRAVMRELGLDDPLLMEELGITIDDSGRTPKLTATAETLAMLADDAETRADPTQGQTRSQMRQPLRKWASGVVDQIGRAETQPPETITGVATRIGNEVVTGATHADAMAEWAVRNGLASADADPEVALEAALAHAKGTEEQGFLTSTGRFVNRVEALEVARRSGARLAADAGQHSGGGLYAEDIIDPAPSGAQQPASPVLPALPTRAEAEELAREAYGGGGNPEIVMEKVGSFMRGFDDAVEGNEPKHHRPGVYTDGFQFYRRAVRLRAEAEAAAQGGEPEAPRRGAAALFATYGIAPTEQVANVELQSNLDPRMARFNDLPEAMQRWFVRDAIRQIMEPIARDEGLGPEIVEGLGSWFEEGSRSIATSVRYMLPADTDPAVVRRLLARVSIAMRQAGYFSARAASEPTGRYAVELNLNRPVSDEEYRNLVVTLSVDADTFNGTTMMGLDPARIQIVLNEGVTEEQIDAELRRFEALLPDETIDADIYDVETVENFDANTFREEAEAGRKANRVDREAAQAYERIAIRTAGYFDRTAGVATAEGVALPEDRVPFHRRRAPAPPAPMAIPLEERNGRWVRTDSQQGKQNKWRLLPFLRRKIANPAPERTQNKVLAGVNPGNALTQIWALTEGQRRHPNPLASEDVWHDFLSDILGGESDLPLAPHNAIRRIAYPELIRRDLAGITDQQLSDAQSGLREAEAFGQLYRDGLVTPQQTAKLFLWGILSRGVNVAMQESAFLDAVNRGIDPFIQAAVEGRFDEKMVQRYLSWAEKVIPPGSPGRSSYHNLNSFGSSFLFKLSQETDNGESGLQRLHNMIADPETFPSRRLRREFHTFASGVGIQNKVLSFVLLVTGRKDVLVLDRVRIRVEFNDGRYGSYNLYDGVKNGKNLVGGSNVASLFDGVLGLAYYEALEDAYARVLPGVYEALGRPQDASLASYHWESWVIDSSQEVRHATTSAIMDEVRGVQGAYEYVVAREGQTDTYSFGAEYLHLSGQRRTKPIIAYPLSDGTWVQMSPKRFKKFLDEIQLKRSGVITDGNFKITEAGANGRRWWDDPRVNRAALDAAARRFGRPYRRGAAAENAGEGDTDGARSGPELRRASGGQRVTPRTRRAGEAVAAYGRRSEIPDYLTGLMARELPDEADFTINGLPTTADRAAQISQYQESRAKVTILGKTVRSIRSLAKLMRPFRDPRFEHMHVLLLDDDGRVVWRSMDTSGNVNEVAFNDERLTSLIQVATRKNARRVVIVHNHPGGDTTPSDQDYALFKDMHYTLDQAGLVLDSFLVINHDEATYVRYNNRDPAPEPKKLSVQPDPRPSWIAEGPSISTPEEIARAVRDAPGRGSAMMLYLDSRNRVVGHEPMPWRRVANPANHADIHANMRDLGASQLMIVVGTEPGAFELTVEGARGLIRDKRIVVREVMEMSESGKPMRSAWDTHEIDWPNMDEVAPLVAGMEEVEADAPAAPAAPAAPTRSAAARSEFANYDARTEEKAELDPRTQELLDSEDPVARVVAMLRIGQGNEQYSRHQIRTALFAARNPQVLQALKSLGPEGRTAYQTERWLPDVRETDTQHTDEVISPQQIVNELSASLQMPILATGKRWAALRRRGVAGAYRMGRRIARIKQAGDVEAAAHEVGHYIHELVYGLTPKGALQTGNIPAQHRAELEAIAGQVSGGGVAEGVAEFFRRYVTNPDAAAMQAPHYWEYVTTTLSERFPDVMRSLHKARDDFEKWRTATDAARVRARIRSIPDSKPPRGIYMSTWDKFVTGMVNDLHYLKVVTKEVMGDENASEVARQPHLLAQLLRGSGGVAWHWLHVGSADWNTRTKRGPALFDILGDVFEAGLREDFTAYIVARRAVERINAGFDVGFDITTAENTVAQLESELFRERFEQLVQYNRELLEMLRDAGVVTEQDFANIEEKGGIGEYIPFHTYQEGYEGGRRGKGNLLSRQVVQRFRGGTFDIIDPLEAIIKNTYAFTHAAMQQRVSDSLVEMMGEGDTGKLADIITPAPKIHTRPFEEVWEEVDKETGGALGVLPEAARQSLARIFRPGDFYGKRNILSVIQNGQRVWFEVNDPALYDALMATDQQGISTALRFLAMPSAWRRAGAVLSPDFIVRNLQRDQMTAFIQSEYGFLPVVDLARGAKHLFGKDDLYSRWLLSGGAYATQVDIDRRAQQRRLAELQRSGTFIPNVVKGPIAALQAISASIENLSRIAEFRRALESEMAKANPNEIDAMDRAALASRMISTDFALHGSWRTVQAIRMMATFWNAGIQGDVRMMRAMTRPETRRGAVLRALLTITIPSLALSFAYRDDEEYAEIPQWQRDLFWLVRIPVDFIPGWMQQTEDSGKFGQFIKPFVASDNGVWLRFPKPFGLGQFFGTIPERFTEWVRDNDPQALEVAVRNLNPLSLRSGSPLFGGLPDIAMIQPFLENWANYSRFLQRPIVSRRVQDLAPELQESVNTTEVAKLLTAIGRKVGAENLPLTGGTFGSPAKMDNLLRSWFGGLGGYGAQIIDLVAKKRPEQHGPEPAHSLADIPVVKAFVARNPSWSSESIERFYETYIEAKQAYDSYNFLLKDGQADRARRFYDRNRDKVASYEQLNQVSRFIAEQRANAEAIERSQMSAQQKARAIEELGVLVTQTAASVVGRPKRRTLTGSTDGR